MIEKLTKKQEKLVPVYRDKWLANGRKTTRINKKKTIAAVKTIYKCAGLDTPKYFFFFPSPLQCQLAVSVLKQTDLKALLADKANLGANLRANLWANLGANLRDNLGDNLWDNLRDNLRDNLGDNLGDNLRDNLGDNLRDNLRDNLGDNLRANLGDNLGDNLRANLGDNLRANLGDNLWDNLKTEFQPMYYGNQEWDIGWIGFYDFILNELFEKRIKEFSKFVKYMEAMQQVHAFIPYKDIVFLSDNPTELNINSRGRLHADMKPALAYSDGYSLFYMNGIKTPKEIVLAKKEDITKELIVKQPNADIRREIIRKIGSEQLLKVLDYNVIDKMDDYELITFDIGDGRVRPYLKMINASDDKLTHVEGVRPEIKSVVDAIKFRNGLMEYEAPKALS